MLYAKIKKDDIDYEVNYELIYSNCRSGPCPAIYRCTNGDYIVQGYSLLDEDKTSMHMSDNESAVYIPKAIIDNIKE